MRQRIKSMYYFSTILGRRMKREAEGETYKQISETVAYAELYALLHELNWRKCWGVGP